LSPKYFSPVLLSPLGHASYYKIRLASSWLSALDKSILKLILNFGACEPFAYGNTATTYIGATD